MRKILFLLLALAVLITSCGKGDTFILEGNIEGISSDTIVVYYQNPDYRLDTIFAQQGKFTYTIHPDTLTIFSLLVDNRETQLIFANKGDKVTVNGNTGRVRVKGTGENALLTRIIEYLDGVSDKGSVMTVVDSLMKVHPQSYTNIYLIDKYYVQETLPDYEAIKEAVKGLNGVVRDTPYMIDLQNKLDEKVKAAESNSIPNISYMDKDGKTVNWRTLKDKYVLLDFWASWNEESMVAQDSLVEVQKALKKEKFVIISLSLDLDEEAWLAACDRDTTQWKQVCDFKGWNNNIIRQQSITHIPANILVGTNKKIIARNIRGQKLIDKVKELINRDEEKAAKDAERKRNKQNRK